MIDIASFHHRPKAAALDNSLLNPRFVIVELLGPAHRGSLVIHAVLVEDEQSESADVL